jgi:hypothetical protein
MKCTFSLPIKFIRFGLITKNSIHEMYITDVAGFFIFGHKGSSMAGFEVYKPWGSANDEGIEI